ncbi:MAG: membrane dipeptidase [Myxococcales bacterium]|nr:membrane dipeptidase [Myxococcales bacterium]
MTRYVKSLVTTIALLFGCATMPQTPTPAAPPLQHGVDLHVHLTMHAGLPLVGDASLMHRARSGADLLGAQLSEDGYLRAGVRVIVAALWVPPKRVGQTGLGALSRQVDALHDFALRHPTFGVVTSVEQARRVIASGRIAVFIGLEGADVIETPADVDRLFALGVRVMSLAHFVDTPLLDAEDGQFGPLLSPFTDGTTKGVTPLGLEVTKRAIAWGMLIDVTHASPLATEQLLAVHQAMKAPLLATHVGSGMLEPRTLRDVHAKAIAELGGLIGVGVFRHPMLTPVPEADRFEGFVPGSCDELIAHALHLAKVVGPEHVALGSDLGAPITRALPGGSCPNGVRGDWDLPAVFAGLEARGFSRESLDGSAARFLSMLEQLEARRSAR